MNDQLNAAIAEVIARADGLISAIDGTTDQFEQEVAHLSAATSSLEQALGPQPPDQALDSVDTPSSVLMLSPDYMRDDDSETFYAWVQASDVECAIAAARAQAVAHN